MAGIEKKFYAAIDPWALILPPELYAILNGPRPQESEVTKAVKEATPAMRKEVAARLHVLSAHIAAVEAALK